MTSERVDPGLGLAELAAGVDRRRPSSTSLADLAVLGLPELVVLGLQGLELLQGLADRRVAADPDRSAGARRSCSWPPSSARPGRSTSRVLLELALELLGEPGLVDVGDGSFSAASLATSWTAVSQASASASSRVVEELLLDPLVLLQGDRAPLGAPVAALTAPSACLLLGRRSGRRRRPWRPAPSTARSSSSDCFLRSAR